jgi:IclR family mhp operon transcriptional activator
MEYCVVTSDVIEPIARTFAILRAMNQHRFSTVSDLHRETGLPKSTVHRLLATLIHCGYVTKDVERSVYLLTEKVLELSQGYGQESRLVKASAPIARRLTREIKWPIAIGTFDYDALVVQYSTRPYSHFTLRPSTVNKRFPLFKSAMGQAWFAFILQQRRDEVIAALRADELQQDPIIKNDYQLNLFVRRVQKRGYGLREGTRGESSHISVPILRGSDVLGVIGASIFSSSMDKSVKATYPAMLRQAAIEIVHRIHLDEGTEGQPKTPGKSV